VGGQPLALPVWDRRAGRLFEEFMSDHPATYDSRPQRSLTQWMQSSRAYDWLIAAYQNSSWSAREIGPFIARHGIDMSEFKPVIYGSFAEFFDREFKPDARAFPTAQQDMGAFSEARYFAWPRWNERHEFPIKGQSLDAKRILGSKERAARFAGGPILLGRLAPMDYHRNHYPDDGTTMETDWHGGSLWTVNWHALRRKPDIFFENHRQISILATKNFGTLAYVEVGAMSVGRIQQVHPLERPFARGAEKSIFKFGGSAVVLFGEAGAWTPAEDLVERTDEGIETLVRLGEVIARSGKPSE
jgi:phosphatidylserine decarboxylase